MVESLTGQLLLASPALLDPNFRRTVVLISVHSAEGARSAGEASSSWPVSDSTISA